MEFTVEVLKMEDGRRFALLLKNGIPLYYPSLYITKKKRNNSYNTQIGIQHHLKLLESWCEVEGVALEERFRSGEELTGRECLSLIDFCAWDAETIRRIRSGVRMLNSAYTQVGRSEASSRVGHIKEYLTFLFRLLAGCGESDPRLVSMLRDIESQKPKVRNFRKIDVVKLAKEQETILKEKIMPMSPDNPWPGSWEVRFRNLLMVHLLLETGIRRSELAGLRVGDIDIDGRRVSIYRRHNDPEDHRIKQPNTKTGERSIPVSSQLIEQIEKYRTNVRAKIPAARKHSILFVAHRRNKGRGISSETVNKVFSTLSGAFPELGRLHPHKLRHHWNFEYSELVDEQLKNMPEDQRQAFEEQTRNYLMGWSDGSKMGEVYNRRAIEKKAREILENRSSKFQIVSKKNNDSN